MIKKGEGICEDAFFLLNNAAGVSDGVGGWSEFGIIPSFFSQSLMRNCSHIIKQSSEYIAPDLVLSQAYERTTFSGGGTALICVLNDHQLSCANVGDSRFLLIRFDDKKQPYVVLQSSVQRHAFNAPYQLTNVPSPEEILCNLRENLISADELAKKLIKYKNLELYKDLPETAQLYQINVQEDDLVVLATDGLFDNLFLEEILESIRKVVNGRICSEVPPKEIADVIANYAHNRSKSLDENSPFSEEYRENEGVMQMVIFSFLE